MKNLEVLTLAVRELWPSVQVSWQLQTTFGMDFWIKWHFNLMQRSNSFRVENRSIYLSLYLKCRWSPSRGHFDRFVRLRTRIFSIKVRWRITAMGTNVLFSSLGRVSSHTRRISTQIHRTWKRNIWCRSVHRIIRLRSRCGSILTSPSEYPHWFNCPPKKAMSSGRCRCWDLTVAVASEFCSVHRQR